VPVISEPAPEDNWTGRTGFVHQAILADFPDLGGYQVYACGSAAMVQAAHPAFTAHGLGPDDCFADAFVPRPAARNGAPRRNRMKALRIAAQFALYVPQMAILAYFSTEPRFSMVAPDEALVRVSFIHATQRRQACRERSAEELAKLAPNMRAAQDCPRERSPLLVELELDGKLVLRREVQPSGLRHDGNVASTSAWRCRRAGTASSPACATARRASSTTRRTRRSSLPADGS
jgi:hypothetical protein